jgi:hypothetical protein
MVGVTNGLMAYTSSNETWKTGVRGEISGIEAWTASLDSLYATDAQLFQLYQSTRSIELTTGSLIGITNGLMAFTAALDSTYATDAQLYQLYAETASIKAEIAGIEAYTASLKAAAIVSSSQQITNYYKFAETASANTFYGNQSITGALYVNDVASTLQIVGNGFGQSSLISPNGALVLTPGLYGVQINGTYPDLQANGNITANGSVTGNIIATNNVVSSSQQITNYYKFAETASANIFYNYQAISGSKFELHTSDANGGLVINSKATSTQTFITLLDRGSNDNSIVATFEDTNGANQLGGLKIEAGRKDNQAGLILKGKNKVANSGAVNGYITSVIGNAYSDNALTTLTTGVTGKSISFLGQDTELANLNFNGDLTITNGNLVVASGKGIDFSATSNSSGTMTSELLNDYEEGTWSPVITDLTNDATMDGTYTRGTYTKIGRQVTVRGYILTTSLGSVTGNVKIKGLPFTNGSGFGSLGGGSIGTASGLNITAGHSVHISTPLGQNHLGLNVGDDAAGTTEMTAAEWSADGQVQMLATYFVD